MRSWARHHSGYSSTILKSNRRSAKTLNFYGKAKKTRRDFTRSRRTTTSLIADVTFDFGLLEKRFKNAAEDEILDTERMGRSTADMRWHT
jgi:hypothetical protein